MRLNGDAASYPRVGRARLNHHSPPVNQLDPDNLRKVSGSEQHALQTHTQIVVAPVREKGSVEHTDQYRGPYRVALDDFGGQRLA
jgi:hypothetical protein